MAPTSSIGEIKPSVLLGLIWAVVATAIVFTAIRTAIRLHVKKRLSADDYAVYVALFFLLSMAIMYQTITPTMFQIDELDQPGATKIPPDFFEHGHHFLKLQFAIIIMFWTTLWLVKFSFLLFYKNIFTGLPELLFWWRFICAIVLLTYIGCWATQLASCHPLSHYFTLGACETKRDIWASNFSLYYSTAVDIFCDLLIMALPFRRLWSLKVTRQAKFALATIFSLGFIIIIFAIVRVVETKATTHHVDPVWLALWSMIEASVAVVVSCLPSFRIFFVFKREDSAHNRRNNSGSRSRSRSRRRSSKHVWRLESLRHGSTSFGDSNHTGKWNMKLLRLPSTSFGGSSHGGSSFLPSNNRAGAESADSYATDLEYGDSRADGSKEYIVPKPPKDRVQVRTEWSVTHSRMK